MEWFPNEFDRCFISFLRHRFAQPRNRRPRVPIVQEIAFIATPRQCRKEFSRKDAKAQKKLEVILRLRLGVFAKAFVFFR